MISSALRRSAEKAVWGRALLGLFIAALLVPAVPVQASRGDGKHGFTKLDRHLNEQRGRNGQSDVIIEFHNDGDAEKVVKGHGGKVGRKLGGKARVARISNKNLEALANDPRVKKVHHDRPVESFAGRTAVTVGARAVQELMGYNGAGVGVAIVDSGITAWHDDLTAPNGQGQRVVHFKDFVNGYTELYDDWGHGTHVAGIVAGNGFDSNGTRNAIAPGANIVALKALDGEGRGTISMIIAAIDYAVANKDAFNIRVLNLSLGAGVTESYNTDPLTLAAKRAVDAGIVVVAAAGNLGKAADGQPQYGAIGSPANAPWVITIGASSTNGTVLRDDDTMAPFSSRGPTMYDHAAKPDLVAPGYGTISLSDPVSLFYTTKAQYLLGGLVPTAYTPYLTLSGTSMATPVVSGTVALMLQANPSLTPNLVKAILQYTSQEYPGYDALTQGTGFLNTRGAVQLAEYFATAQPGSPYPTADGWSKQIFWGNKRVKGGVLTPAGTAWNLGVNWGASSTPTGNNIVWGDNCPDPSCTTVVWGTDIVWGNNDADDIVWGNNDDDSIVWGNSELGNIVWGNNEFTNIVWGNNEFTNIVWGNSCAGEDCDGIVWGNNDLTNIVWGNNEFTNIVWGNNEFTNIVWGNNEFTNIVWGNNEFTNIVWGNATSDSQISPVAGDETAEVNSLPSSMWDCMFPHGLQQCTPPAPADETSTADPATEAAATTTETAAAATTETAAATTDTTAAATTETATEAASTTTEAVAETTTEAAAETTTEAAAATATEAAATTTEPAAAATTTEAATTTTETATTTTTTTTTTVTQTTSSLLGGGLN